MGNDSGRADERPAHLVEVGPYRAAARSVSNREYARFLDAAGREPPKFWDDQVFRGADLPVVGVTWFDAVAYCDWLSAENSGFVFRPAGKPASGRICRPGMLIAPMR